MLCIPVSLAMFCILKSYMLSIDVRDGDLNYEGCGGEKKTHFLSRKRGCHEWLLKFPVNQST